VIRTCLLAVVTALLTGCGGSAPASAPGAPPVPSPATGAVAPSVGSPSTVTARVRTGGQPCGVVAAAGAVWVTDAASAQLLRISPTTKAVVRRTSLDRTPCELAFGYGALWVSTQSGVLDRVAPATGRVVARITVGAMSYEPLVAFGSVWVSNRNSRTVSQVDPRTNKVVRTITLAGLQPGGLAEAGQQVVVGNDTAGDNKLAAIDPRSGAVRSLTAGGRPAFVAAADRWVFVANQDDGAVSRLDPTIGKVLGTVPAGTSPVNLATLPGARPEVWVPDDVGNLLTRIDGVTGQVLERMLVGAGPAVVAPAGKDVWVTNFGDGSVWRISPGRR
jgi:YVTN family beta-propeller protein